MLYGRHLTGPLSILKDFCAEDIPVPIRKLKSVTNYLKIKLQLAAEEDGVASSTNQANYIYYNNRLKKYKNFEIGDKVIYLAFVSTHKKYARWTSPCTIVEKRSAPNYLVQMPDNSVKHIYANEIGRLNIVF
ncbi:hypothetical protein NPIL_620481 [Nephila pilipes]|uniref:Uncharacterized protein n=1 Tax=Nephila pilipes TaxID=299642 RepID=A0A8X6T043_NEPPI|nr:hypothetical protein NPIL_620481 [Nephila pilipes]